jgi:glutaredoxin
MAKAYFQENAVQYQEKNVATDIDARNVMIQKSGQLGVPVIEIDNKIIIGFDKPKLQELLGIK